MKMKKLLEHPMAKSYLLDYRNNMQLMNRCGISVKTFLNLRVEHFKTIVGAEICQEKHLKQYKNTREGIQEC